MFLTTNNRGRFDRIWLWKDWPERWGTDAGIDIVARARTGELWAIQAKADHPDRAISKREIDSFLSESNRPQALWIAERLQSSLTLVLVPSLSLVHPASHRVGHRPNRIEPRAIKRRPTPHDWLTKPRAAARAELLTGCSRNFNHDKLQCHSGQARKPDLRRDASRAGSRR